MEQVKYNDFKAYNDQRIPKGETIVYELLAVKKDTVTGNVSCPRVYIRPTDTVMVDGDIEQIACIKNFNPDGSPNFDLEVAFHIENLGQIQLRSGDIASERQFKFLSYCNGNASNAKRSEAEAPIFKLLESPSVVAEREFTRLKQVSEANSIVFAMNTKELKTIIADLSIVSGDSNAEMALAIKAVAEKDPSSILKSIADKTKLTPKTLEVENVPYLTKKEVEDIVTAAIDSGKIIVDTEGKTLTVVGQSESFYTYSSGKFSVAGLVGFLRLEENASKIELLK